jgi:hypothetical protein
VTEEELAQARDQARDQARLQAQIVEVNDCINQLNARADRLRLIERELILCAAVVYLSGIVLGVIIAKQWWGL